MQTDLNFHHLFLLPGKSYFVTDSMPIAHSLDQGYWIEI
jgi:hypothetical protein